MVSISLDGSPAVLAGRASHSPSQASPSRPAPPRLSVDGGPSLGAVRNARSFQRMRSDAGSERAAAVDGTGGRSAAFTDRSPSVVVARGSVTCVRTSDGGSPNARTPSLSGSQGSASSRSGRRVGERSRLAAGSRQASGARQAVDPEAEALAEAEAEAAEGEEGAGSVAPTLSLLPAISRRSSLVPRRTILGMDGSEVSPSQRASQAGTPEGSPRRRQVQSEVPNGAQALEPVPGSVRTNVDPRLNAFLPRAGAGGVHRELQKERAAMMASLRAALEEHRGGWMGLARRRGGEGDEEGEEPGEGVPDGVQGAGEPGRKGPDADAEAEAEAEAMPRRARSWRAVLRLRAREGEPPKDDDPVAAEVTPLADAVAEEAGPYDRYDRYSSANLLQRMRSWKDGMVQASAVIGQGMALLNPRRRVHGQSVAV